VKGGVVDGKVDGPFTKGQTFELRLKAQELTVVMSMSTKAIEFIGDKIDGRYLVPTQRESICEPTDAAADVRDSEGPRGGSLDRPEPALNQYLVTLRSDIPLVRPGSSFDLEMGARADEPRSSARRRSAVRTVSYCSMNCRRAFSRPLAKRRQIPCSRR